MIGENFFILLVCSVIQTFHRCTTFLYNFCTGEAIHLTNLIGSLNGLQYRVLSPVNSWPLVLHSITVTVAGCQGYLPYIE